MAGARPGRRAVLAGGAAALAMPFILRRANASQTLYVNSWGGTWEQAAQANIFKPFTDKTGIDIKTVSPVSFAKLVAQARTGVYDFDVSTVDGFDLVQGDVAGVIEPFNAKLFDADAHAPGQLIHNGVASHVFSLNICYNKTKFPGGGPQSWAEFWDVAKYPQDRSMWRDSRATMTLGLYADGVPRDKLFPIDIDHALKSLDRIKSKVRVWWSQGMQSQQLVQDGEVDLIAIWHSRVLAMRAQGLPVELVWNEPLILPAYWVVSKGSPRAELGWRLIDFATSAKPLAGFCKQASYGPANPKAFEFIAEADQKDMPTTPEHLKTAIRYDAEAMAKNGEQVIKRFDQWIAQ